MTSLALKKAATDTNMLSGLWFVALFAMSALYVAQLPFFQWLGLSPLIIGIVMGMGYGNTIRGGMPEAWTSGISFAMRPLLKLGVVLYGFRLTFQDIAFVGLEGVAVAAAVVASTFVIGTFFGIKVLGMDRDTAILTTVGSSVCGAAAILATEPVLKSEPHKSGIAVATVVVFGTITMFAYPALYSAGLYSVDPATFGIYIGGTIHEVAHAVAAGQAVGGAAADTAVIAKMIRVLMLAPLLVAVSGGLAWFARGSRDSESESSGRGITIPWFALLFVAMAGINSLGIVPEDAVELINTADLFILTMAMCALGIETSFARFRNVGMKPVYLALLLFGWVTVGGYGITCAITSLI